MTRSTGLVRDYEQRKMEYPGCSLLTTRPSPFVPEGLGPGSDEPGRYLGKWLDALDERYGLLALGIDLPRYEVFNAYAPKPFYPLTADGSSRPIYVTGADQVQLDYEAFARCQLLVIETALHLGRAD